MPLPVNISNSEPTFNRAVTDSRVKSDPYGNSLEPLHEVEKTLVVVFDALQPLLLVLASGNLIDAVVVLLALGVQFLVDGESTDRRLLLATPAILGARAAASLRAKLTLLVLLFWRGLASLPLQNQVCELTIPPIISINPDPTENTNRRI